MGQIPKRLVEAVNELQDLPEQDSDAMATAIVREFGDCICQTQAVVNGHRVFIEMCAGHQFLTETDRACTRIQHLRFGRAMKDAWRRAEWGGFSGMLNHDLGL